MLLKGIPLMNRVNVTIAEVALPSQPILAIRHEHINVKALPELIGQGFGALSAYIAGEGGVIADDPYVVFYGMSAIAKLDEDDMSVEITFPLQAAIPGNGHFVCRDRQNATAARATYKGAYDDGMVAVYKEMIRWIREHGGVLIGQAWESYRSGPMVPETEHVTVITLPFRRETNQKP